MAEFALFCGVGDIIIYSTNTYPRKNELVIFELLTVIKYSR